MAIQDSIDALTASTTSLLDEVLVQKVTLDTSVNSASINATTATAQAIAAATSATNAATSATNAATSAALVAAAVPKTKSANYTAASGELILADTSAGSWTLTLPSTGGNVSVRDQTGTWGTNPLTIAGNGATIAGAATFLADASGCQINFTLIGTVWRYTLSFLYGG